MAGATPNDTMSARLSYSLPKVVSVRVMRAMRPSRPSKIMATKMAMPAGAKFLSIAATMA
jgi:hypothetical protein